MRSIIGELYELFPEVDNYSTPERAKVSEEYRVLCQRVEDALGPALMDRLMELHEKRLGWQGEDHFAAGLRAGIRLMIEVFTSATE